MLHVWKNYVTFRTANTSGQWYARAVTKIFFRPLEIYRQIAVLINRCKTLTELVQLNAD